MVLDRLSRRVQQAQEHASKFSSHELRSEDYEGRTVCMSWYDLAKFADRLTLPPGKSPEERPTLKTNDVIRVFHGFRDLEDAIAACRYGISGKSRVGRVYSYEADNNPQGLFVTTGPKKASEFGA